MMQLKDVELTPCGKSSSNLKAYGSSIKVQGRTIGIPAFQNMVAYPI